MTASVAAWICGRNCAKTFGSPVGEPSCGLRACRCRIAAPASAASRACLAMSAGVYGRAADSVGVWMAPVTAQVMMTLLDDFAMHCTPVSESDALFVECLQVREHACPQRRLLLGSPAMEALRRFHAEFSL